MLIDRNLILKAKEKLGDENEEQIVNALGLVNYNFSKHKCCCPYHREDTPSFIYNSKAYEFHCFGCQKNVDIVDAFMQTGLSFVSAVKKLFDLAGINYNFAQQGVRSKNSYRYPKKENTENKNAVLSYLGKRKISPQTVRFADIGQDEKGNIAFHYYDINDVLTLVKYRPSRKVGKSDIKCWCQKDSDTSPLLFNMNRINTNSPLLICEGEIDCLSAIEAGYTNAVSVPFGAGNYTWIEENWDFLEQFESIIICSDNDDSGEKMRKETVSRLGSWRTRIVEIPEIFTDEKGKKYKVKDLNETLYYFGKSKVMDIITNAAESGVESVHDLSDIEDIDLDSIEGITTGINGIDRELMKLFYGTLTIVSGAPGAGKTSFLYQIICQALDQGKNCWLFSKELPEWLSKNWFNYILAGRKNVMEYSAESGAVYYKVTDKAKKAINDYYKGRWFIYRDDAPSKTEDLIKSMTEVIRKYGVKLLVIDNLMSIDLEATQTDELKKQTAVINELISLATKYNVAVILVAHPRKMLSPTYEVGIYDISGSSNIINLAHRTIGLRRVTDTEKQGVPSKNGKGWEVQPFPFDVSLTVIKDRIRGRANFRYGLKYDVPTRRFFSNSQELNFEYGWCRTQTSQNNTTAVVNETIPDEWEEIL